MSDITKIILQKLGGEEKAKKTLKEGSMNKKWIKDNYEDLKRNYLNKFIAVLKRNVIVAKEDIEELLDYLNKKYLDNNEIAIEFIGSEKQLPLFL